MLISFVQCVVHKQSHAHTLHKHTDVVSYTWVIQTKANIDEGAVGGFEAIGFLPQSQYFLSLHFRI